MSKNLENRVQQARDLARKYMREGWGSRPSVLHAIYDLFDTGIREDEFLRICTILNPFHAPAGALYENGCAFGFNTCGTLAGALASFAMVHGARYSPKGPDFPGGGWERMYKEIMTNPALSPEKKVRMYLDRLKLIGCGAYYQIVARFKARMGTTDCLRLREPYCKGDPLSREAFKVCSDAAIEGAGIAAEVILEYEQNPDSLQIGEGHVHLAELRNKPD